MQHAFWVCQSQVRVRVADIDEQDHDRKRVEGAEIGREMEGATGGLVGRAYLDTLIGARLCEPQHVCIFEMLPANRSACQSALLLRVTDPRSGLWRTLSSFLPCIETMNHGSVLLFI